MIKQLRQLDIQELDDLSIRIDSAPEETAARLFPDRPDCRAQLTQLIGQWAINQKIVLESTAEEMPHIALVFGKVAQRIWQKLPEYARFVKIEIE